MDKKTNRKDATGNEIIIGNVYGYSQSSNGFCNISIGKALHFTKSGLVSLEVYERRRSLYNNEPTEDLDPKSKNTTCKPIMLFPVNSPSNI